MPLLFGECRDTQALNRSGYAPPAREHADEQLESITAGGVIAGAWRAPGVPYADALFRGTVKGESVICLCDGEITNREELKREAQHLRLESHGTGIAELVALLVCHKGPQAFNLVRGGFTCVVLRGSQAYLTTDRFGMKRLSYSATPARLLFSSRVRNLTQDAPISLRALAYYLNLSYVPNPDSIFEGVRKLPPGCCLSWQPGREARIERYWEMVFPEDLTASEDALGSQLRELLQGAVTETLHDVRPENAGCYLSGGTDSSSVMGMTGRVLSHSLSSYTITFEQDDFSELEYARIAARHFGSKIDEFTLRADDGWAAMHKLVEAFDEPFGNPSAVGGYHCALNAQGRGVNVMLAGDGGDELFGGNERYRKDVIYSWIEGLPRFTIQNPVLEAFWAVSRNVSASMRLKNVLQRAALKNPERFYLEDCLSADLNGNFLTQDLANAIHSRTALEIVREYYESAQARSELNRLLFVDLKMTIGDNDLVKVRQTAAAAGVRVRYPMLDHPLAEFTGRVPGSLKVKGLQKRYLFKHALRNFLPQEILKKKKHGFGVPVSDWFRSEPRFRELLLDVTHDRVTEQRGYFRKERVHEMVDEHLRSFRDWGQTLWALLMLELWQRAVERG